MELAGLAGRLDLGGQPADLRRRAATRLTSRSTGSVTASAADRTAGAVDQDSRASGQAAVGPPLGLSQARRHPTAVAFSA